MYYKKSFIISSVWSCSNVECEKRCYLREIIFPKITEVSNLQKLTLDELQLEIKVALLKHDWLTVETWCGKVFYLDNNHYSSFQEVGAAANYFTDQQCGPMP